MQKLALAVLPLVIAHGQILSTAWVELGEGGQAIARVVVNRAGGLPQRGSGWKASRDDAAPARPRRIPPVCEAVIPAGTQIGAGKGSGPGSAARRALANRGDRRHGLPHQRRREVQNCNSDWPFESVAKAAAAAQPQLVIHVGDYLYREDRLPSQDSAESAGAVPMAITGIPGTRISSNRRRSCWRRSVGSLARQS